EGRPSGSIWRDELVEQGMAPELVKLLESCFERPKGRPADASVLAEKLGALLKPPVVEFPKEKVPGPAKPEPVRVSEPPKEIVNSIGMKLKLIPAGEFLMGSPDSDKDASNDEKPQHRVRITQPFYLGMHQVTRGQFRRFVDANGYRTEAENDGK